MGKRLTTHWVCIICRDVSCMVEHDGGVDGKALGLPDGWRKRTIIMHPGTQCRSDVRFAGVCPDCSKLSDKQAYGKAEFKDWKFVKDEV